MKNMILKHLQSVIDSNIVVVKRDVRIPAVGEIDILATDRQGNKYFIEVKREKITDLDVGRIARFSTVLSKKEPSSKFVLICKKVGLPHKQALSELGVRVIELGKKQLELGIILQRESERSVQALKLSPKEQESYFLLLRKGMWVVTPDLLSKQLDIPNEYSKNILADLARKGVLARFGRGKYVVVSPDVVYQRKGYTADPIMILDQLLYKEPYYVAYQSALYIHGIAHQLPFTTSVAVTKQKRPLKIGNSMIKFVTVKKPSMFGFRQQRYLDSYVNVSDLEKTILDCVDRHDLCGGIDDVTRSISEALAKINGKKLLFYLKKLRNQVLPQRLGFVLEKLISVGFKVDPDLIANMERLKGRHMHRLDFNLPKRGKKSNRWNIIENVDCLGWRHA